MLFHASASTQMDSLPTGLCPVCPERQGAARPASSSTPDAARRARGGPEDGGAREASGDPPARAQPEVRGDGGPPTAGTGATPTERGARRPARSPGEAFAREAPAFATSPTGPGALLAALHAAAGTRPSTRTSDDPVMAPTSAMSAAALRGEVAAVRVHVRGWGCGGGGASVWPDEGVACGKGRGCVWPVGLGCGGGGACV